MWVELEDIETGRALMSLSWMEATPDREVLAQRQLAAKKEDRDLSQCLLHVYVDSCKDISPLKGAYELEYSHLYIVCRVVFFLQHLVNYSIVIC